MFRRYRQQWSCCMNDLVAYLFMSDLASWVVHEPFSGGPTGVYLWRRDDSVLHAAHSGKLDQSICWHIKLAVLWSQLPCARCKRRSGMFVRSLQTVNAMVKKTALCNSMQDKTRQYSEPYYEMSLVMSRRYNKALYSGEDNHPENRRTTHTRQVQRDAVEAGGRVGTIFKEPTITPNAEQSKNLGLRSSLPSPNGAMRRYIYRSMYMKFRYVNYMYILYTCVHAYV